MAIGFLKLLKEDYNLFKHSLSFAHIFHFSPWVNYCLNL